ncbi:MAG: glycoside hydrolase family 2 protein [Muribaculaceae bacterium]|nr:glycoside hydrolase family 2 protein [Muribaculaceae bacterium]
MKILLACLLTLLSVSGVSASHNPEFSTAGFFNMDGTGRHVYSMNPAWRFHKEAATGAETKEFDDSGWPVVSLPDGIELLPAEASGCINYQGEVWYRKHFTPDSTLSGKKLFLHFEGIMGKSRVYVNGQLLSEHFGGYLPVVIDVSHALNFNADNVISVWADNSNDPAYPPGKPQEALDFTYFGGIYRDCWLIAHNDVFITDPTYENTAAGGGLFVAYDNVSDASADILLKTHVRNDGNRRKFSGKIEYRLLEPDGNEVASWSRPININKGGAVHTSSKFTLRDPHLWSPDDPYLYNLIVRVIDSNGTVNDGYRRRIGIRSIEFKGKDGFWLNGKPYGSPLIGANRHQDFAIIGHALPNSLHWRDAKKLRDAGLRVIRNAHCPQDPAFMDACDELGLFVIVNTPGWQFWNDASEFADRVYSDIRNMVRRDRNHPCVWMWEPILNETWYPADFAKKALDVVNEEYPYPYCYSGCDNHARGSEYFPVRFAHPATGNNDDNETSPDANLSYFTREWGDCVDNWSSHNSPSRVARNWGEHAMLVQARHYASPSYKRTCFETLYQTGPHHVGGCLWHSFDHQRGYHPDPFYGGIMDMFRQPKYSYYMFTAQRPSTMAERIYDTGPMVYIAHEMTPFSPSDVTVYSNCDEMRLTFNAGGVTHTYTRESATGAMPSPIITFKDVYDFMTDKALTMDERRPDDVMLTAEGLIDGKVVATHTVRPARRPERLNLRIDDEGTGLTADGSDIVTVIAEITDRNGNVKRLNNSTVKFDIEGEGRIIGSANIQANPVPVKWGTAPVLIQSTLNPGKIKVKASVTFEGLQTPVSGELEFESKPTNRHLLYDTNEAQALSTSSAMATPAQGSSYDKEQMLIKRQQNERALKEVERQQSDFGE